MMASWSADEQDQPRPGWWVRGLSGALCLAALSAPRAQVAITEFMPINRGSSVDRDGLSADWIELQNLGDEPFDLTDHYLSDDPERRARWRFPSVEIEPRGFLVVWASGKNRAVSKSPLHTNFRLGGGGGDELLLVAPDRQTVLSRIAVGPALPDASQGCSQTFEARVLLPADAEARYRVPVEGDSRLPTDVGYDDSEWSRGRAPFGFDRKRIPTLHDSITTDVEKVMRGVNSSMWYRFRFDIDDPRAIDLFVLRVRFETGFVAYLNDREIARRRAPKTLSSEARAEVGLEPRDPERWEQFAIGGGGGIVHSGRNVLAVHALVGSPNSLEHVLAAEIVGYTYDAPRVGERLYLDEPTPGRPNGGGLPDVAPPPIIDHDGALFRDTVSVTLRAAIPSAAIRYTLDGTEPGPGSRAYGGPIVIDSTAALRARTFVDGLQPSAVVVAPFTRIAADLESFSSNLPLVVVSTFGGEIQAKNFVPAHVHVVDRAGERSRLLDAPGYSGPAGVKWRGSSSLERPKKSYGIELRDAGGAERAAPLLGMPEDSHWVLYGPHNWDQSHLRNALAYELARRIGLDAPRTRFCEVFVAPERREVTRADYAGLYLLIERVSRGRHRIDVEELTTRHDREPGITGGYMLKIDRPGPGDMGFEAARQQLQYVYPKEREITQPQRDWIKRYFDGFGEALTGPDMGDPQRGYERWIDVPNWIDYHFFNEYVKDPDAYTLSTYMYKPRGGKVRMGPMWDCDRVMRTNDAEYWVGRPSDPTGWNDDCYYSWWGDLFRDEGWRRRYRARGRMHLASELRIERVHALIDELAAEIEEAEERDRRRWPIIRAGEWYNEIIDLREWVAARTEWFREELLEVPVLVASSPDYEMPFTVTIEAGNEDSTVYYTDDGADPRLANGELSPRAKVYTGPIRVDHDVHIYARERVGELWSRLADRWYVRRLEKLTITELMYNPKGGRDYEFIEVRNYGDEPIDLAGVRIDGAVQFHFSLGDVPTLGPGEVVVVVRDRQAFADRHDVTGIRIAGEFWGRFSNTEDEIRLYGPVGEELARVAYEDWFELTDGGGHSLEARAFERNLNARDQWKPSVEPNGTPGR